MEGILPVDPGPISGQLALILQPTTVQSGGIINQIVAFASYLTNPGMKTISEVNFYVGLFPTELQDMLKVSTFNF